MSHSEPEALDNVSEISSAHGDEAESRASRASSSTRLTAQPYGYSDHLNPPLPDHQHQHASPYPSTPLTQVNDKEKGDPTLKLSRPLETHSFGLWLILLYAFTTLFSWTVTCILSHRPIGSFAEINGGPTYYDQSGDVWRADYINSDRWRQAASIGSAIVSAVGIPLTSAICAGATSVYCQRESTGRMPFLTLRQTLALADKGWSDIGVICNLTRPSTSRKTRSGLLVFSIGLVSLGEQLLQYMKISFLWKLGRMLTFLFLKSVSNSRAAERTSEISSSTSFKLRGQ